MNSTSNSTCLAGEDELVVVLGLDRGGPEGHLRVALVLEEVAGEQVAVPLLVAGVDARHPDLGLGAAVRRVRAVDVDRAVELVERAADLGHHRVAGDEADGRVRRVEGVVPGQGRVVGSHDDLLESG